MKPAITKPGTNEMRLKCGNVRSAVSLREENDDEECDLTMISDTEETSISLTRHVENVRPKPCKLVGIEPKLSSIVTLYSADPEDTEDVVVEKNNNIEFPSQETQPLDECAPPRPEIPADFVPRCGR